MIGKDSVSFEASEVDGAKHLEHNISTIFGNSHEPKDYKIKYSNNLNSAHFGTGNFPH